MTHHKTKTHQYLDDDNSGGYHPKTRQRGGKYPRKQGFREAEFRPTTPKKFKRRMATA